MAPSYFQALREEARRLIHDIAEVASITSTATRFLVDSHPTLTTDQAESLKEAQASAERTATLIRELNALIG